MRKTALTVLLTLVALTAMPALAVAARHHHHRHHAHITKRHKRAKHVARGQRGPRGERGPEGPAGATGPAGPAGASFSASNVTTVRGEEVTVAPEKVGSSTATCPAGDVVVGGGYNGPLVETTIGDDEPLSGITWDVVVVNESVIPEKLTAIAICAS